MGIDIFIEFNLNTIVVRQPEHFFFSKFIHSAKVNEVNSYLLKIIVPQLISTKFSTFNMTTVRMFDTTFAHNWKCKTNY